MDIEDEKTQIVDNGEPDEIYVVDGAELTCTLGDYNSKLIIPISHGVYTKGKKQANVGDHIEMKNIMTFGKCSKVGECNPNIPMKWLKGKEDVIIEEDSALLNTSFCTCAFGGVITIVNDGQ